MEAKDAAARRAIAYVKDGMTLGLGTGTTATFAIQALGERIATENLRVRGVPTSERSRMLAEQYHIPVVELNEVDGVDLTIDGADEADPDLHLIKGGGGALVREKLVACASRELVIVCDSMKLKSYLGAFPLPVAVVPFGWSATRKRLAAIAPNIRLRASGADPGQPFVTDDGLLILDMELGRIDDVPALEREIKAIPGVVEVGLFVHLATRLVLGFEDGHTEERTPINGQGS